MKKLPTVLLTSMLLIASSAFAQTQEYIREQHATFISKRDSFIKESQECRTTISNTADGILVNKEILISHPNDANRYTLATNPNKLTPSQKEIFKNHLNDIQKCRNRSNEQMNGLPQEWVEVMINHHQNIDDIYIKLLTDEYTIGDANKKAIELMTKLNLDLKQADRNYIKSLNDQLYSINQKDNERRQQAKDKRQQDAERRQQRSDELLKEMIRGNKSVDTNCTTYGNRTNCTSW
jgi:uncharacterized protein (DUF305 family)